MDGIFLIEVDRLLRPGGYFVWTSLLNTLRSLSDKENQKKWTVICHFAENLCWDMLSQQDETIVWKKTTKKKCYSSRKAGPAVCGRSHDTESPYYKPLNPCIAGTRSERGIPSAKKNGSFISDDAKKLMDPQSSGTCYTSASSNPSRDT